MYVVIARFMPMAFNRYWYDAFIIACASVIRFLPATTAVIMPAPSTSDRPQQRPSSYG